MLAEQELRREDFRGDVPIVLDDGQTWYLPFPRIRLRAELRDGVVMPRKEHSFGLEYFDKVERFYDAGHDESQGNAERFYGAVLDLAISLLRRNYDLDFETAALLFHVEVGASPDSPEGIRYQTVVNTALGLQKKTLPAG